MNSLVPRRATRRLKITETKYGRTIEAWTYTEDCPSEPTQEELSLRQKIAMGVSLFGWGLLGIAVGNMLFVSI